MTIAPANLSDAKLIEGFTNGAPNSDRGIGSVGLWVCHHTTETQIYGYTHRNQQCHLDQAMTPQNNLTPPHYGVTSNTPSTPQLCILDNLDDYLPEDSQNTMPGEE
jgi:hypothetical protein